MVREALLTDVRGSSKSMIFFPPAPGGSGFNQQRNSAPLASAQTSVEAGGGVGSGGRP